MGTVLKKRILNNAREQSIQYGQAFKAYCKLDNTVQTQHVQSEKAPSTDLAQYAFPKPMKVEGKCQHDFCLKSLQEAHLRPIPL